MEKKRARRRRDEQNMKARVRSYARRICGAPEKWLTGRYIGKLTSTHFCDCDRVRCRYLRRWEGPPVSERRRMAADGRL
jgi:hypothetical protein